MRKILLAAFIVACAAPFTFAQNDYNKVDVFVGYSHNRVDTGFNNQDPELDDIFDEREGFHGFNGSVAGNVSRYVGIKGDYSFHRRSFQNTFAGTTVDTDADLHQFFGGVQFKDNSTETRVKPFAHLMAGLAHARSEVTATGAVTANFEDSETGFAGIIGGGIDIRVSPRVDIRAIQFDYNPTRLGDETQNNFRIGVGVVFR